MKENVYSFKEDYELSNFSYREININRLIYKSSFIIITQK